MPPRGVTPAPPEALRVGAHVRLPAFADEQSTGWTDHNVSDPGVTLLQALVYGIGALGLTAATVAFVRLRRASRDGDEKE
jgi:hypothetical protein